MSEIPRVVASERAFSGRVFNVRVDRVRYEDGDEHRLDVVEHRGSIAVLAVRRPGELVLVRQYRHPAARFLWELPAGTTEPGEDPATGAARELREETGYRAERLTAIGSTFMTPGFCEERMHFFLAEDLVPGDQSLDEDERIDVGVFSLESAWRMVAGGEIADVKTLLGLLWMASPAELRPGFGR
jgi:ADP-ribose pyrophosphatase